MNQKEEEVIVLLLHEPWHEPGGVDGRCGRCGGRGLLETIRHKARRCARHTTPVNSFRGTEDGRGTTDGR
eukprot:1590029-Prymnesium_polylepis.1